MYPGIIRVVVAGFWTVTALAQPGFEIASIRPSRPGAPQALRAAENGRLNVSGWTAKLLIQTGWHFRDFQILGGPKWIGTDRFDIVAKNDEQLSDSDLRIMIQTLLHDRFGLAAHQKMRELPVYALVPAKTGAIVRKSDPATKPNVFGGRGQINAHRIGMAILAQLLSTRLEMPVLDRTDLKDKYDFNLEWDPEENPATISDDAVPAAATAIKPAAGPSIFTAVREQMGLRLEVQKGPVPVLVIDSIKMPSEN
jgi:uncharacterized protein (TIGR03435 family)